MMDNVMGDNSDLSIKVELSRDSYLALLSVDSKHYIDRISKNIILDKLKEKNITYGINVEKIDAICSNAKPVYREVIARGIPHINGEDGRIEYKVEVPNSNKPTVLSDGSVDFKAVNRFVFVKQGEVLAHKIPPTLGQDGRTVTNKIIKAKVGKQISFSIGKNIVQTDNGDSIVSCIDGSICMEGTKISVIEVLEIQGDVGVKTGNIEFKGKVVIRGNVLSGYNIHCDGDLEIDGVVEGCNIFANGNVFIARGVNGNDGANIKCSGNLISKFLNNCKANVGGNIQANVIMHSDIDCNGFVEVIGAKGHIIGGSIKAKSGIKAKVIGSTMGTSTRVIIGMDTGKLSQYDALSKQMKEIKANIKKVDQVINLLNRKIESEPNNIQNAVLMNKSKISKQEYMMELATVAEEYRRLQYELNQQEDTKIYAEEVNLGVRVSIGQTHLNIKQTLNNVEISKLNGEIHIAKTM